MKRTAAAIILILGIIFSAAAQVSGPMDLIVLLDTSASMSNYYQETSDYLIGPFLREFLRIGDTFHLISFSKTAKLELSRRIEATGDVETIIGRMLLLYPLDPETDIAGALSFAEQYAASIPGNRQRKIVLISDGNGGTQAVETAVSNSSSRLRSQGADLQFISVPVSSPPPSSGRPPTAQTAQAAQPSVPQVAQTQQGTTGQATPGQTQTQQGTAGQTQQTNQPPQQQTPAPQSSTQSSADQSSASPAVTQTPGTTTSPPPAVDSSAGAGTQTQTQTETQSSQTQTQSPQAGNTAGSSTTAATGTTAAPPSQPSSSAGTTSSAQTSQTSPQSRSQSSTTGIGLGIPLWLLIILIILGLIILGLIIFLISRRLQSSPNRAMAKAAASSRDRQKSAEVLSSYGDSQKKAGAPPLAYPPPERKPLPRDKPDANQDFINGPAMLSLFVQDQNTAIGRRNIHNAKEGSSFTVGGGNSDFLIFLVPVPPYIAEVHFDGRQCTFIPKKPQYFPDIGSQQVSNCIGKTIRVISDRNYELHIRIERYEDPLKALNKLLNSISVPNA